MTLNTELSVSRWRLVSAARRFDGYTVSAPRSDQRGVRFAKGMLVACGLSFAFWVSAGIVVARLLR